METPLEGLKGSWAGGRSSGAPGGGRRAEAEPLEEIAQPLAPGVDGYEAPPAPAAGAPQDVKLEHPGHQGGPGERAWAGSGGGRAGRRRMGVCPGQLSGLAGGRDHLGAQPGMRGQDAMEAEQMEAGGRNQDAEFLDELDGIQEEMGGAIAPRMGKLIQELSVGALGEAVQGQRGPQEVAAEVLELLSGLSGEGHIGVEGETLQVGAAGLVRVNDGGGGAKPADGLAGPGPGGDEELEGGGGVAGQQGELLGHGIGGAGILGQAPAAAQQASDSSADLLQDVGDLLVSGGGQGMEHGGCAGGGAAEDAIQDDGVEMDVGVEGGAVGPDRLRQTALPKP